MWRRTLAPQRGRDQETEGGGLGAQWQKLRAHQARFTRWFDPAQVLGFVLAERRRVRVERLGAHLEYSFADIATTGKLMGAIYALSGVLPPPARLTQVVSWEAEDRASLKLAASARVWPLLVLLDALWFAVRNLRWRKPAPEQLEDGV